METVLCYCEICERNFIAKLRDNYTYMEEPSMCPECEKKYDEEHGLVPEESVD